MATQSPGKSINPSWHYVSAEADTREEYFSGPLKGALKTGTPRDVQIDGKLHKKLNLFFYFKLSFLTKPNPS